MGVLMEKYHWTPDYMLKQMSLPQVMYWFNIATQGVPREKPGDVDRIVDDINSQFVWNEEKRRWE